MDKFSQSKVTEAKNGMVFHHPTKLVFGIGKVDTLKNEIIKFGRRALFISTSDTLFKTVGLQEKIRKLRKGIQVKIFSGIKQNPSFSEIERGVEVVSTYRPDVLIAIGGGSAIDAAKAIGVGAKSRYPLIKLVKEPDLIKSSLPVIALPTTAGTGAELSRGAILTDPKTKKKMGLRSDSLIPNVAIVDPKLTLSLPPELTLYTGFDALSHAIETLVSKKSNILTNAFSEIAIKLLLENLHQVITNGKDIAARVQVSFAATLMGYNLVYSQTCLPHRIQYALASVIDISHPRGVVLIYPAWLKRVYKVTAGNKLRTLVTEKELLTFMHSIKLISRLRNFGIGVDDVSMLSNRVTGDLKVDPVYKNKNTIKEILIESI
ncbi:iron-containing alcohol dehydrogenase [Patescibacteria group bacterium AH-259-L07]|nr:iron-containing alcohol dehydrogenase [Patescibacteria group bacterium AH-259-L07]